MAILASTPQVTTSSVFPSSYHRRGKAYAVPFRRRCTWTCSSRLLLASES